jgi:hypothetical protein
MSIVHSNTRKHFLKVLKKSLTNTQTRDNIISTKQRTTQQSVKALQTHIVANSKVFVDNHTKM